MRVFAFCISKDMEIEWIKDQKAKTKIKEYFSKIVEKKDIEVFYEKNTVYVVGYTDNKEDISLMKCYGNLVRYLDKKFNTVPYIIIDNLNVKKEKVYEFVQLSRYKFISNKRELIEVKTILKDGKEYKNKEKDHLIEHVYKARDLINLSLHKKSPSSIVNEIKESLKNIPYLKIKVIKGKELLKEKLNLIYNVGKGSENNPYFVIIEYFPLKKKEVDVGIIGKGVLFDAGGYNLKRKTIKDMKLDVSGGIVALYSLIALAKKGIKKNIVVGVPLVENLISGNAYLPGDVITSYSGKSVEIVNTDAEGRLILADALSYIQEKYKVKKLIDIATLTGACMVALGKDIAGVMGNDKYLLNTFVKNGWEIGEFVWELPLIESLFNEELKSNVADIKNISDEPWGGAIIGGMFLKNFIKEDTKWIHLDIAGPSYTDNANLIYNSGATAFGLRLLYNVIKDNL